tara:strand:- start:214 stop:600 length:387 start_codon:yes stop_codon:yes gene_type:complete
MKINLKYIALISVSLVMTSCATITGDRSQAIQVTSNVESAICSLTNTEGQWTVETPGSVIVARDSGNLLVNCKKKGYKPATVSIESYHTNASTWGNVVLGGGIGYIIDRNTGAAFYYPDTINVALEKE